MHGLGTSFRNVKLPALLIGLLYFLAAAAALIHATDALHAPDETEYLSIAQNIIDRGFFSMDGIAPTAWRSPGLPMVYAVLWLIWPSVYLIKAVTLACWMATGLIIARLATHFRGPIAGYLAATLFLLYAYELYAATTLYPQSIAGLIVVSVVATVVLSKELTLGRQVWLAVATAFLVLLIPNCIVVAAIVYPYAVLRRKMTVWAAIMAAGLIVLVVMGWCARNERALGGFTFTTTMGITLYEGNRDEVVGGTQQAIANTASDDLRGFREIDVDAAFRKRAVDWLKSHPSQAAGLIFDKFVSWFAFKNEYLSRVDVPMIALLSVGMACIQYPVMLGALIAIRSREKGLRDLAVLSWLLFLAAALTYVMFLTRLRYRLPFDTLLFATAPCIMVDAVTIGFRSLIERGGKSSLADAQRT